MENELIEELEEMMMNTKSSSSSSNTSTKRKRNEKAIMLCTTKPSYTLKTGDVVGSLRCENRNRLWYLLGQLVRRQNWSEASGVLSVLLIATLKETSLSTNRTKYWATLEILKHIGAGNVKPRKIQQVYDIWFKKISGSTKGRFDVIQEYVLFLLSQGDIDGAYQAAIGLQQENVFRSDGIANLTVGLVFCHLWYNAFKKELQPRVQENVFEAQLLSNYEEGAASNTFSMEEEAQDYNMTTYGDSDDDEINDYLSKFPHTRNKQYASVFYAHNVENLLLPLQFPSVDTIEDFMCFQRKIKNDHYKAAVKHLQTALHTTPSVEALVPLIQMLTIGDQIKEAAEAVESVVENSNVAIPFRLRASLLEIFSNEESSKLHICFEDILTKDPTCRNSVLKLINLHHNGYYRLEKLIEMIALHLEATYADSYIWKEFASCFIRLVDCDEDRISSTNDDDDDVSCTKRTSSLSSVPDMFLNDTSSETWKLRCRWWRTRHFTKTILSSETDAEKMELVGYKAASACHLYGIEFPYVVTAHTYLKSRKNKVSSVLKVHMKNAIGLSTRLKLRLKSIRIVPGSPLDVFKLQPSRWSYICLCKILKSLKFHFDLTLYDMLELFMIKSISVTDYESVVRSELECRVGECLRIDCLLTGLITLNNPVGDKDL
ncbi:uncharacterized protein [Rutidosis leptorrhynchoides]|uniref:uncharacterized protein n=1 Tax=Rutidosis leptorrhynchoides TaxID=125765 RepID=UPI003A9A2F7B